VRLTTVVSLVLALGSTSFCLVAQDAPLFSLREKQGPNAVGFKVIEQYDFSRTFQPLIDDLGKPYQGERARPLQTLVWYPSLKSSSKPMTVGDYVALKTTETNFGKPQMPVGLEEWLTEGMKPTFAKSLWAIRDAVPAAGRFTVIKYSPILYTI